MRDAAVQSPAGAAWKAAADGAAGDLGARGWRAHWPAAVFVLGAVLALYQASLGWSHPILEMHGYRQTHTAISVPPLLQSGPRLAYETPILGPPWQIPIEFPLYQWLVAGVVRVLGTPLDATGRAVSLACFWLALAAAYDVLRTLGVSRAGRWLALTLLALNPTYILWSRAFLMESVALLLSTVYLACFGRFLVSGRLVWLALSATAAALAAVVKLPTFFSFALASSLLVVLHAGRRTGGRPWLVALGGLALVGVVSLAALLGWNAYADAHKRLNPLAALLASDQMGSWYFGALADRCDPRRWARLWMHLTTDGYAWPLLAIAAIPLALGGDRRRLMIGALAAFVSAPVVFLNVHCVHNYYLYGHLLFLIVAVAVGIDALLGRPGWRRWLAAAVFGSLAFGSTVQFWGRHADLQRRQQFDTAQMAGLIERCTAPDEILVVYGRDWCPDVPYYARRRALMIPGWATPAAEEAALARLNDVKVGALLVARPRLALGPLPDRDKQARLATRLKLGPDAFHSDQNCDVYLAALYAGASRHCQAAREAERRGDLVAAEAAWTAALESHPAEPELLTARGLCRIQAGRFQAGIADFQRVSELLPTMPRGWALLGAAWLCVYQQQVRDGQAAEEPLRRATQAAEETLKLAPYHASSYELRRAIDAESKRSLPAQRDAQAARRWQTAAEWPW